MSRPGSAESSLANAMEAVPQHHDGATPIARGFRGWITHRSPDVVFAPRWWWALLSVLTAAAVHTYVAWTTLGPVFSADEVGAVGASRAFATGGGDWTLW